MGSTFDYIPTQLTKAFREAQADERFQGWLKMQEAIMGIEFPIYDLPEVRDSMFTTESLTTVEAKLIELYPDNRAAYATADDIHRTMRYVYYIGETYRRCFEGTWVAIPRHDDTGKVKGTEPGIQVPFRENFIKPAEQIAFALIRRTGNEVTMIFGYADRDYNEWLEAGRPDVEYRGTLREEDN